MNLAGKQKKALAALEYHEKTTGTPVPQRVREFWKKSPFRYDELVTKPLKKEIPDWGDGPFGVRLTLPSWNAQSVEFGTDWDDSKHYLPLFHSEDSRLFIVGLRNPKCPVYWYDEEVLRQDGVVQVASSLDEFLNHLTKAPKDFDFDETFDDEIWEHPPDEEVAKAEPAPVPRTRKKVKLPDGDYLAWTTEWLGYKAELATDVGGNNYSSLGRGRPTQKWRKGTFKIISDWKESPPLLDEFPIDGGDRKLSSERVVRLLERLKLTDVEYLPVRLKDQKGNDLKANYFVINPFPCLDVLDLTASSAKMSTICKRIVEQVKKVVLQSNKIPKSRHLFRIENFDDLVIVSRSLAEALAGEGFEGVKFESLNKPWPHF